MDVHKEATVIAVLNGSGKLVMESIVETKASSILQFIHGLRGELHGYNRQQCSMNRLRVAKILIAVATMSLGAFAQDGFFYKWENRVRSTMSQQPPWPVPLFSPTSNITQLFRYDIVRQITPAGTHTWNYGFSKGFNLIPWYNTEIDVNLPPYIQHNSSAQDGFGDFGMIR